MFNASTDFIELSNIYFLHIYVSLPTVATIQASTSHVYCQTNLLRIYMRSVKSVKSTTPHLPLLYKTIFQLPDDEVNIKLIKIYILNYLMIYLSLLYSCKWRLKTLHKKHTTFTKWHNQFTKISRQNTAEWGPLKNATISGVDWHNTCNRQKTCVQIFITRWQKRVWFSNFFSQIFIE